MDPDLPLDDDELDSLDEFLRSSAVGDDALDVSMLDGFLTALAVGPNNLPPALWLSVVWGERVTWPTAAEESRQRTLVLRHANALLYQLREDPETFEPLFWERDIDGRRVTVIDEWCSGFVRGMSLDESGWQPLLDDEENANLLDVILLHGTEEGAREIENDPTLEDDLDAHADLLVDNVVALMAHWLPQRRRSTTLRHEAPRAGRNDPCPCGSGKKFKKCCGANERLH